MSGEVRGRANQVETRGWRVCELGNLRLETWMGLIGFRKSFRLCLCFVLINVFFFLDELKVVET